jgi:hypothetical protein
MGQMMTGWTQIYVKLEHVTVIASVAFVLRFGSNTM